MHSRSVLPNEVPPDLQIDPSIFVPQLLPGETVQGLLTAIYVPPRVKIETFSQRPYSRVGLSDILYVSYPNRPAIHQVYHVTERATRSFWQKT